MKTLKFFIAAIALFFASSAQSQFSVSLNLGTPPLWGPSGYADVHYYYLPDVEAFYDVKSSMFIYNSGGVWIHRSSLPARYRDYDLYGGYKVVMNDYHGNAPYSHYKEYKTKYARGYRGQNQRTIGERPGKGHPEMKNERDGNHGGRDAGHDRGRQEGPGRGKGDQRGHEKNGKNDHDNGKNR
ncbi:MAG: hypothetical protein WCK34_01520 [Bacteroidota bacterium]